MTNRIFIIVYKLDECQHCFTMTEKEIRILGTGKGIDRKSFVYGTVTSMIDDDTVPGDTYFWFQKEPIFDPKIEPNCIGMNLSAFWHSMNTGVIDKYVADSCDKIRQRLSVN